MQLQFILTYVLSVYVNSNSTSNIRRHRFSAYDIALCKRRHIMLSFAKSGSEQPRSSLRWLAPGALVTLAGQPNRNNPSIRFADNLT